MNHRGHFYTTAAEAMRRILVESARRKQTLKRGGDRERLLLDAGQIPACTFQAITGAAFFAAPRGIAAAWPIAFGGRVGSLTRGAAPLSLDLPSLAECLLNEYARGCGWA